MNRWMKGWPDALRRVRVWSLVWLVGVLLVPGVLVIAFARPGSHTPWVAGALAAMVWLLVQPQYWRGWRALAPSVAATALLAVAMSRRPELIPGLRFLYIHVAVVAAFLLPWRAIILHLAVSVALFTVVRPPSPSVVQQVLDLLPLLWPPVGFKCLMYGEENAIRLIQLLNEENRSAQRTNDRLQRLLALSQDLIMIASLDGTILSVNPAAESVLGYKPEDVINRRGSDLVAPEDLELYHSVLSASAGGQSQRCQIRVPAKDQRVVWIEWTTAVDQTEGVIYCVGRDITARKQAEQRLEESEQRYKALFDNSPDALYSLDLNGIFLDMNPAAVAMGGYTREELVGRSFASFMPEEALPVALPSFQKVLQGESQVMEVSIRHRQGHDMPVILTAFPMVVGGQVVGVFGSGRDLTARKLAEQMEREAAREREQMRDRFVQIAAHELRNPMAGIKAMLSLQLWLAGQGKPLHELEQMAAAMEREIDRLSSLLNEILLAFRIRDGHLPIAQAPVDLAALIDQSLEPFRIIACKHRLRFEGDSLPETLVLGDAHRLEDVVRNLVSNAVKYSPDGGDIVVRLSYTRSAALISVSDQGLGVPADQLQRIFEGFFRASNLAGRDPGGLGLGLYICREFVQRHGGRMWVESIEGTGTTFFVELPRAEAACSEVNR